MWELFAGADLPIRTIHGDPEVFYEQFGYPEPQMNFLVWFWYQEHERDAYENLVREIARRSPDGGVSLLKNIAEMRKGNTPLTPAPEECSFMFANPPWYSLRNWGCE